MPSKPWQVQIRIPLMTHIRGHTVERSECSTPATSPELLPWTKDPRCTPTITMVIATAYTAAGPRSGHASLKGTGLRDEVPWIPQGKLHASAIAQLLSPAYHCTWTTQRHIATFQK